MAILWIYAKATFYVALATLFVILWLLMGIVWGTLLGPVDGAIGAIHAIRKSAYGKVLRSWVRLVRG